jgi:hypothetical protein
MTDHSVEPHTQRGSAFTRATADVRIARLNAQRADEMFDRLWGHDGNGWPGDVNDEHHQLAVGDGLDLGREVDPVPRRPVW